MNEQTVAGSAAGSALNTQVLLLAQIRDQAVLQTTLLKLLVTGQTKIEAELEQVVAEVQEVVAALGNADIASFDVTVSTPIKQTGEAGMAKNVRSLGNAIDQAMLDDQKATMSLTPKNSNGDPTALPTGSTAPTYAAVPGTAVTLDPSIDPTGLSCDVKGVKGQAGDEVVTASFTNADGSVATGQATFHQTIDPAELDVASFDVSVSTPVKQ